MRTNALDETGVDLEKTVQAAITRNLRTETAKSTAWLNEAKRNHYYDGTPEFIRLHLRQSLKLNPNQVEVFICLLKQQWRAVNGGVKQVSHCKSKIIEDLRISVTTVENAYKKLEKLELVKFYDSGHIQKPRFFTINHRSFYEIEAKTKRRFRPADPVNDQSFDEQDEAEQSPADTGEPNQASHSEPPAGVGNSPNKSCQNKPLTPPSDDECQLNKYREQLCDVRDKISKAEGKMATPKSGVSLSEMLKFNNELGKDFLSELNVLREEESQLETAMEMLERKLKPAEVKTEPSPPTDVAESEPKASEPYQPKQWQAAAKTGREMFWRRAQAKKRVQQLIKEGILLTDPDMTSKKLYHWALDKWAGDNLKDFTHAINIGANFIRKGTFRYTLKNGENVA